MRIILTMAAIWVGAVADQPELALTDLPEYCAALQPSTHAPAIPATFRQLWSQPERFRGKFVQVEGRLMRRFRQGAVGQFPALVESTIFSPSGDPFCLVYPEWTETKPAKLGDRIKFEGIFLRQIRYSGSDTARMEPLIVGDRAPALVNTGTMGWSSPFRGERLWLDATAALAVGMIVIGALAKQWVRTPRPTPRHAIEPEPEFLDPETDEGTAA